MIASIEPAIIPLGATRDQGLSAQNAKSAVRIAPPQGHRGLLQFSADALKGTGRKSVPPLAASGGRYAILDPADPHDPGRHLSRQQGDDDDERKRLQHRMRHRGTAGRSQRTPTIEERRLIEAELEAARAELAKRTGEELP
jgi:hypothetical protein